MVRTICCEEGCNKFIASENRCYNHLYHYIKTNFPERHKEKRERSKLSRRYRYHTDPEYRARRNLNTPKYNKLKSIRNQENKKIIVKYYSDGTNCCKCCGENILEFLSIDHINGGGNKHRRECKITYIYGWLIKNNFPSGFQILCYNCNQARGFFGQCPHQRE